MTLIAHDSIYFRTIDLSRHTIIPSAYACFRNVTSCFAPDTSNFLEFNLTVTTVLSAFNLCQIWKHQVGLSLGKRQFTVNQIRPALGCIESSLFGMLFLAIQCTFLGIIWTIVSLHCGSARTFRSVFVGKFCFSLQSPSNQINASANLIHHHYGTNY